MIVNKLKADQALGVCQLIGKVPNTTFCYRVRAARKHQGRYKEEARRFSIDVIDVDVDARRDALLSPVTLYSTGSTTTTTSRTSKSKQPRRSPRQACLLRLETKQQKTKYDTRYTAAFKEATSIVATRRTGTSMLAGKQEPVSSVCKQLNEACNLDGRKKLKRSTVYEGAKDGSTGKSPKKKGPAPKIPGAFVSLVATRAEVCQVGDGERKGRDFKQLIGASIVGTPFEDSFQVESVWRKVQREIPHALQAGTNMLVDNARTQRTTHDNLNQWFDDARKDILSTGLAVDENVFNEDGVLVSEVRFLKDTERPEDYQHRQNAS